jgi:hypothetical protein
MVISGFGENNEQTVHLLNVEKSKKSNAPSITFGLCRLRIPS